MRVYRDDRRQGERLRGRETRLPESPRHAVLTRGTLLRLQSEAGNGAVVTVFRKECCTSCSTGGPCKEPEEASPAVQRLVGDGHDLTSPRFAGDQRLEECYDDQARLTQGATGESVIKIQSALAELGYDLGPAGVDGSYGPKTWNAVKAFKNNERLGWETMGDVGPGTMRRLNELFPPDIKPDPDDGDHGDGGIGACNRLMFGDDLITTAGSAVQLQAFGKNPAPACDLQLWLNRFLHAVAHPLDGLTSLQRARLLQLLSQDNEGQNLALRELSTLPTSDLLDALRVDRLFATTQVQGLQQHASFLPVFEARVNADPNAASPRVAAAIRTARTGTVSAQDRARLSTDDAATFDALANARNWPALLHAVQPGSLSDQQGRIVDFIRRARDNVPDRSRDFRPTGDGFVYNGKSPKDPNQIAGADNRAKFNQLVWTEIAGEGGNSAINTSQLPRWGRGFLDIQLVRMVSRFISTSPAALNALLDAGITIGPRAKGAKPGQDDWLIVDEQTGVIKEGSEALALIKRDLRVLSLLAELGEDEQTTQAFADAQFEQLRAPGGTGAAAATDAQVAVLMGSWNPRFVRFAAHAIQHGANANWTKYLALGSAPSAQDVVRRWGKDFGAIQTDKAVPKFVTAKPPHLGALFCQPVTTTEMLSFAGGLGAAVLGSSSPLPAEYTGGATSTGPAQFAGHIFYGDLAGPKAPGTKDPVNWFHLGP